MPKVTSKNGRTIKENSTAVARSMRSRETERAISCLLLNG